MPLRRHSPLFHVVPHAKPAQRPDPGGAAVSRGGFVLDSPGVPGPEGGRVPAVADVADVAEGDAQATTHTGTALPKF